MLINSYIVNTKDKEDGNGKKIIFIRGTASSGKSILAMALGNTLEEYYVIFPVEDVLFFQMIPTKYLVNGVESKRGFAIERNDEDDITHVHSSPWAIELYKTHMGTLAHYTEKGFNIICDGNLIDEDNLSSILQYIPTDYQIYIFSLDVPLNILQRREQCRQGERVVGFAKHQYYKMSQSFHLDDMTIKINDHSRVEESVHTIINYCNQHRGSNIKDIMERFNT